MDVTMYSHVVPGIGMNLFSVKALKRTFGNVTTVLDGDRSYIAINGEPALQMYEREGMYFVQARVQDPMLDLIKVRWYYY